jgi:hypothetical protein
MLSEYYYADCRVWLIVMLNIIMLNAVMLNVIMLSAFTDAILLWAGRGNLWQVEFNTKFVR